MEAYKGFLVYLGWIITDNQPYFTNQTKSGLLLWKWIEEEGFTILPILAKKAQTIAEISAYVEQAFSYVKHIKTHKMSQLKPVILKKIRKFVF